MKLGKLLSLTAGLGLLSAMSAFAAPIVFDFSPSAPQGAFGTSQTFTSGGYTITAYGFVTEGNTATALYHKYTTGNPAETGLGIAADSDHEIPPQYYIQLDVQNLIAAGFGSMTFTLGSLQGGEQANIYGDTSAGSFASGTLLSTLTGGPVQQSISLALTSRYFNVTGGGSSNADPVLESVTVNSPTKVPDGGATALLIGASFLALAAFGRRKA